MLIIQRAILIIHDPPSSPYNFELFVHRLQCYFRINACILVVIRESLVPISLNDNLNLIACFMCQCISLILSFCPLFIQILICIQILNISCLKKIVFIISRVCNKKVQKLNSHCLFRTPYISRFLFHFRCFQVFRVPNSFLV